MEGVPRALTLRRSEFHQAPGLQGEAGGCTHVRASAPGTRRAASRTFFRPSRMHRAASSIDPGGSKRAFVTTTARRHTPRLHDRAQPRGPTTSRRGQVPLFVTTNLYPHCHVRLNEATGEQAPGGGLAVAVDVVDVVEHQLMAAGGAGAPVDDLLAGQLLKHQVRLRRGSLRLRPGLWDRDRGSRAGRRQHGRSHRRSRTVGLPLSGRCVNGRLLSANVLPLTFTGPRLGRDVLVQPLLGGRPALRLAGVRHRRVDGGRDRAALRTAVQLPVLAARAVPVGVQQHAVVAPRLGAALLGRRCRRCWRRCSAG